MTLDGVIMGKRQQAAQQTRIKIIKAAKKLFDKNGLDQVKIEDITKEAKVSKGSFYTYFKKKDDIVKEISNNIFETIKDHTLNNEKTIYDKICNFLTESVKTIKEAGIGNCKTWFSDSIASYDEKDAGQNKLYYDLVTIEDFLNTNSTKKEDLKENAQIIVSEYYGILTLWCISNGAIDPIDLIQKFCSTDLKKILENKNLLEEK